MPVRARGAPEAEVDAVAMQGDERTELLGDHEGGVVGQHDAPRAHPDVCGRRRDRRDENGGGGARDSGHPVVLGHPEAPVAQAVGEHGGLDCLREGVGVGHSLPYGGEVEHGERNFCERGHPLL